MVKKTRIFFSCPDCGRTNCRHQPTRGSLGLMVVLGMLLAGSLVLFTFL